MSGERPQHLRRVVILTSLPVEYKAVRSHLTSLCEEEHSEGTVYEWGRFTAGDRRWEVAIVEIGAGNTRAALETERAIAHFNPSVALFVGVAGGIKDVSLGDVIAATKVYGYESGKAGTTFKLRPDVGQSSYLMEQRSRAEARKDDWQQRIEAPDPGLQPRVLVGPVAAGEKVVASTRSPIYKFLRSNYNDALAVEMEGRGFFEATHAHQQVASLIIRGISDLIDGKHEQADIKWQAIAARHASAFAFEVLTKLDRVLVGRDPVVGDITADLRDPREKWVVDIDAPSVVSRVTLHFESIAQRVYDERSALVEPGRVPAHAGRVVEYLVRLTKERQGTGRGLSDFEWKVLASSIWLRELQQISGTLNVVQQMDTLTRSWSISSLVSLKIEHLWTLPSLKIEDGEQLRPRLLGALLLLAESLDIDHRSVNHLAPQVLPPSLWLRRYVAGTFIHEGQIGPVFTVPRVDYVPYLQVWLGGPLQRAFNLVAKALIEEEWYLWLVHSTTELDPKLEPIPESLWQELTADQNLLSVLRPLIETLAVSDEASIRPRLTPMPLTMLRQPPSTLNWDLLPLPSGVYYEVQLRELDTGPTITFRDIVQPPITDLSSITWQVGRWYRWTIYERRGHLRRDLAYGLFQILPLEALERLTRAESELAMIGYHAVPARRVIWRAMGLFESVITELLEEVERAPTVIARLAARRELAETYDQLAQLSRRQQLDSLTDEYSQLATEQYRQLRAFVRERRGV